MSTNPLIAPRVDSTQWFSGVFLIEDLDTIEHGLASGSWIETGLGGLALGLDALSTIVNPLEAVVSWGVAWLLEHVEPLSDALEVLAGDADQIMAFSQTWSNVGAAITAAGVSLRGAIDRETIDWTGAAAEAYRGHMNEELGAMVSLAKVASVLGQVVLGAGLLVSCVRQMVRDAIAQFVGVLAGALPQWLAEEGITLGLATPVVIAQAAALVGKWIARVRALLMALIRSIRNLIPIVRNLDKIVNALIQLIKRLARSSPGGTPRRSTPTARPARRFSQQEVDDIVRGIVESDVPARDTRRRAATGPGPFTASRAWASTTARRRVGRSSTAPAAPARAGTRGTRAARTDSPIAPRATSSCTSSTTSRTRATHRSARPRP